MIMTRSPSRHSPAVTPRPLQGMLGAAGDVSEAGCLAVRYSQRPFRACSRGSAWGMSHGVTSLHRQFDRGSRSRQDARIGAQAPRSDTGGVGKRCLPRREHLAREDREPGRGVRRGRSPSHAGCTFCARRPKIPGIGLERDLRIRLSQFPADAATRRPLHCRRGRSALRPPRRQGHRRRPPRPSRTRAK